MKKEFVDKIKEYFRQEDIKPVERMAIARYEADCQQGLSEAQAEEHRAAGWTNEIIDAASRTVKTIVLENVCTYFNLIFAILGGLLIFVGSFRNLTFLPVIIFNTLIGIVQEIRAKRVLDKMNMLNAPQAKVIRSGTEQTIPSEELVIDDIVVFRAGNQICADAKVVSGEVQVNEALLTGESDDIIKRVGDNLMSGSYIVSGECRGRLEQVGRDSYISKLTIEAKAMKKTEQSEMIRSLNKLLKWVGIIIIPIALLLLWQSYSFNGETFRDSVTAMVAAVIGMIPEGLYLLASVALAVSSIRLAGKNVLLHDMKSIETLARVNVLCVDKTGTITENTMSVHSFVKINEESQFHYDTFEKMMGDFTKVMSDDNITMAALKDYFKEGTGKTALNKTSFSSALKYSSVTYEDCAYVLGAPEMVLREDYEHYQKDIESYSQKGYRVLVFAGYMGTIGSEALTAKAIPLGYILLANPIRANAKTTFHYFAEQGVEIKVISGDNPVTVSEIAGQAGIAHAESYVDASLLDTPEKLAQAAGKYTVFGRVSPEQKRILVQALKVQGNTVAMTGDGVNDVLALKDADCSIAMASGSEAAAQAAQVVLLDSDFSCMPSVVLEGRRVVNNIERSASLFLVKNIYSFMLAVFSVIFMITYPLEPTQVSLITMFTIGIPGFFLALEPNKARIKGHFMTNVLLKALPAGLTDVISVAALVFFGQHFMMDSEDVSTAATILLAVVGFMILVKISKPMNRLNRVILVGCIIGLAFSSFFLSHWFYMSPMSKSCIMLVVIFAIATESLFRYLNLMVEKIRELYIKVIKNRLK